MKEEESSSLELLLDTMCNTFGGVMFIAITLAVVLFSRNALNTQQTPEERTVQRHEELIRQIEELKTKVEEMSRRQRDMTASYLMLEKDPRLKMLKQIAVLEELVKSEKAKQTVIARQLHFIQDEEAAMEKATQQLEEKRQKQEAEILALTGTLEAKEKVISSLTEELKAAVPVSMAFTVLTEHKGRRSYFILLRKGRLWRIGPKSEKDSNGVLTPEADVTYSASGRKVVCFPKENAGVPALDGDQLSVECVRLFQDIPSDRGARICFSQEDAEVFYKMRELLKSQGIFHGFSIQEKNDSVTYYFSNQARYEY